MDTEKITKNYKYFDTKPKIILPTPLNFRQKLSKALDSLQKDGFSSNFEEIICKLIDDKLKEQIEMNGECFLSDKKLESIKKNRIKININIILEEDDDIENIKNLFRQNPKNYQSNLTCASLNLNTHSSLQNKKSLISESNLVSLENCTNLKSDHLNKRPYLDSESNLCFFRRNNPSNNTMQKSFQIYEHKINLKDNDQLIYDSIKKIKMYWNKSSSRLPFIYKRQYLILKDTFPNTLCKESIDFSKKVIPIRN